jgi:hypothetical protein
MLKEQKKNICNFIHFSLALWEVGQGLSCRRDESSDYSEPGQVIQKLRERPALSVSLKP